MPRKQAMTEPTEELDDNSRTIDEIADVDVGEIVNQHGTPIYVYNLEKIKNQYRKLDSAFDEYFENYRINFAVKSNFNPVIVKNLVEQGACLDCASRAELMLADRLEAEEIMYTAPYNRKDELNYAAAKNAIINLDSVDLLSKLDSVPDEICFRIDPGISGGDFGVIADGETKFGVPKERAVEAYRKAKNMGVENFGIHMMTGSNVKDPEYFEKITRELFQIMGDISDHLDIEFDFIDIGGGLGVPYKPSDNKLNVKEMVEKVSKAVKDGKDNYEVGDPEIVCEPGRYLVCEAGHLLTKVTGIKNKESTTFAGLDTGMHQNLRPSLLDAYHEVKVYNPSKTATKEYTVVGPVCSSIDRICEDRNIPELDEGDILSIENVGAYGFVMASHWNSRPLPKEIAVEDGEAEVVREKENISDIFHGTDYEHVEGSES